MELRCEMRQVLQVACVLSVAPCLGAESQSAKLASMSGNRGKWEDKQGNLHFGRWLLSRAETLDLFLPHITITKRFKYWKNYKR